MPWGFIGRKAFNAARSKIGKGMKPKSGQGRVNQPRSHRDKEVDKSYRAKGRNIKERHKKFTKRVTRRRKDRKRRK